MSDVSTGQEKGSKDVALLLATHVAAIAKIF
jgi:hypothetical protein